jgi:hypothetical protein
LSQVNHQVVPLLHQWFGVGKARVSDLVCAALRIGALGYTYTDKKGLNRDGSRRDYKPWNRIDTKWIALLRTHFDTYTRPEMAGVKEMSRNGKIHAVACSPDMQTHDDLAIGTGFIGTGVGVGVGGSSSGSIRLSEQE